MQDTTAFPARMVDELLQAANDGQPGQGGQDTRGRSLRAANASCLHRGAAWRSGTRFVLSALGVDAGNDLNA